MRSRSNACLLMKKFKRTNFHDKISYNSSWSACSKICYWCLFNLYDEKKLQTNNLRVTFTFIVLLLTKLSMRKSRWMNRSIEGWLLVIGARTAQRIRIKGTESVYTLEYDKDYHISQYNVRWDNYRNCREKLVGSL